MILHVQHFLLGCLSTVVQNLSVDYAHPSYFVGQGHGGHTQPLSDRWYVSLPSFVTTNSDPPLPELQAGLWRQSCDELVILLDTYSQTLLFNLRRFQDLGDNSGAGMIKSSCVNCLAHLAVLCQALSNAELDALCDSTLERLGELAQDMCMEEYTRLDLLLGVRIFPMSVRPTPLTEILRRCHGKRLWRCLTPVSLAVLRNTAQSCGIGGRSSQKSMRILRRSYRTPDFQISRYRLGGWMAALKDRGIQI